MIAGGALFGAGSGFLEMAFGAVQEVVSSFVWNITNLDDPFESERFSDHRFRFQISIVVLLSVSSTRRLSSLK